MIKFGKHPRTGNLVKVVGRISAHPPVYRCQVVAGDRIYTANYTREKLERKFDPISRKEYVRAAEERRQFKLFDMEPLIAVGSNARDNGLTDEPEAGIEE